MSTRVVSVGLCLLVQSAASSSFAADPVMANRIGTIPSQILGFGHPFDYTDIAGTAQTLHLPAGKALVMWSSHCGSPVNDNTWTRPSIGDIAPAEGARCVGSSLSGSWVGDIPAGTYTIRLQAKRTDTNEHTYAGGVPFMWSIVVLPHAVSGTATVVAGACCVFGTGCTDDYSASDCEFRFNGVYAGDASSCNDPRLACHAEAGACCVPDAFGGCEVNKTPFECALLRGAFLGVGTTCLDSGCASGGCPAPGSCCELHRTGGCDDAACCARVCATDPACCLDDRSEWDETCVRLASQLCGDGENGYCPSIADLDRDGDIDLRDHALMQSSFNVPE